MSCFVGLWILGVLISGGYIFLGFWLKIDLCFNITKEEYMVMKQSYFITGGVMLLLISLAVIRYASAKLNFIHTDHKKRVTEHLFHQTSDKSKATAKVVTHTQGTETIWIMCAALVPILTIYLETQMQPVVGHNIASKNAAQCWYTALCFGGLSILAGLSFMIVLTVFYFCTIRKRVIATEYMPVDAEDTM
uniref:Uncharacterized protein n=1 Tax=Ranid herpesvirus 4 TaxID=2849006 RepID=A0A8F3HSK3_9VIRU|nr:MAG: hypothetical protein [Ranid herpesvirus 4]